MLRQGLEECYRIVTEVSLLLSSASVRIVFAQLVIVEFSDGSIVNSSGGSSSRHLSGESFEALVHQVNERERGIKIGLSDLKRTQGAASLRNDIAQRWRAARRQRVFAGRRCGDVQHLVQIGHRSQRRKMEWWYTIDEATVRVNRVELRRLRLARLFCALRIFIDDRCIGVGYCSRKRLLQFILYQVLHALHASKATCIEFLHDGKLQRWQAGLTRRRNRLTW